MVTKSILMAALFVFSADAGAETFEISITNVSARDGFGGQNISGPALILHDASFSLFRTGRVASRALWETAEEGDTSAAIALEGRQRGVISTHQLTRIPRRQAGPSTNRFSVDNSAGLRFSLAGMLTSTNDGFAGLNAQRLPQRPGEKVMYVILAWDAGSEENNERCPYVPCAAHYIRKTEGAEGRVAPHAGIRGIADVDRLDRGWPADNVVGTAEITRIN